MSKKEFKIFDYYTGESIFDFSFTSYEIALRYWKTYTRNDTMGRLIIIKEDKKSNIHTTEKKKTKCPACNTGVHFPGKIMRYNDEGILVEDDCGRCKGTGFVK